MAACPWPQLPSHLNTCHELFDIYDKSWQLWQSTFIYICKRQASYYTKLKNKSYSTKTLKVIDIKLMSTPQKLQLFPTPLTASPTSLTFLEESDLSPRLSANCSAGLYCLVQFSQQAGAQSRGGGGEFVLASLITLISNLSQKNFPSRFDPDGSCRDFCRNLEVGLWLGLLQQQRLHLHPLHLRAFSTSATSPCECHLGV